MVSYLRRGEATQTELIAAVTAAGLDPLPQPSASSLLKELRLVGLIEQPRRRGPYRLIAPHEMGLFIDAALTVAERGSASDSKFVAAVRSAARTLRAVDPMTEEIDA